MAKVKKDALALLNEGVTRLTRRGDWRAFLACRARFRRYSVHNAMLIALQCPQATRVAGYRTWRGLGRQVKRGERGIAILAPILRKVEDEEEARRVAGFRTVHVFDVSQTEGEPLPEPPRPAPLQGGGTAVREATRTLEAFARSRGVRVAYGELPGGALGCYTASRREITVRAGLPPLQAMKTLVHELAHALLHAEPVRGVPLHRCELEAESCAFLVCHALGLDTSAYSFAYLAGWSEGPEELLAAGAQASRAAEELLAVLPPGRPAEGEGGRVEGG